jgi:hypothetical protein
LHVHEHEDETWLILAGEYVFRSAIAPSRRIRAIMCLDHGVCPIDMQIAGASVARALIMVTPAGFEGFWRESTQLGEDPAAHEALGQKYGVRSV